MDRRNPVADGEGGPPESSEATDTADGAGVSPDPEDAGVSPDPENAGVSMEGTWRPEDVPEMLPDRDEAGDLGPLAYAAAVRDAAALDAAAAADHVDRLVGIARETRGDSVAAAVEALAVVGRRRPETLAVWTDDLVALASDDDPVAAGAGFRALAPLAADAPAAAAAGADAARRGITASDPRRRLPALRLVAAIAEADPERVTGADRGVADAMGADDADVRTAGTLCAAALLAAAPGAFPRTASAVLELLDDPDPEVRETARVALVRFAREHPSQVPEKRRAIEAIGGASDGDLGLVEGATKDALTSLLEAVHGYSF